MDTETGKHNTGAVCAYAVRDSMHRDAHTIGPGATLKEAVALMVERKTNSLIVVDNRMRIVGMVSSWDVIAKFVPKYLKEDHNLASFEMGDVFCQRLEVLNGVLVEDVMETHVVTIKEGDALISAAALLAQHRLRQVPVVSQEGELSGYVNRTDIKLAMADALGLKT